MIPLLSHFIFHFTKFSHGRRLSGVPAQSCDSMEPIVPEWPTEFKLCHQTLIPLSLPLFLCDLAALQMDWANRERARERMDRNKGIWGALKWPLSLIVRPFMNDWFTFVGHGIWFGFDLHLVLGRWTPSPPNFPCYLEQKLVCRQTHISGQICSFNRHMDLLLSFSVFLAEEFPYVSS